MLNRNELMILSDDKKSELAKTLLPARRANYHAYHSAALFIKEQINQIDEFLKELKNQRISLESLEEFSELNKIYSGNEKYFRMVNGVLKEKFNEDNKEKMKYRTDAITNKKIIFYNQTFNNVSDLQDYKNTILSSINQIFSNKIIDLLEKNQKVLNAVNSGAVNISAVTQSQQESSLHHEFAIKNTKCAIKVLLELADISCSIQGKKINFGNQKTADFVKKIIRNDAVLSQKLSLKKVTVKAKNESHHSQRKAIHFIVVGGEEYPIADLIHFFCNYLMQSSPEAKNKLIGLKNQLINSKSKLYQQALANSQANIIQNTPAAMVSNLAWQLLKDRIDNFDKYQLQLPTNENLNQSSLQNPLLPQDQPQDQLQAPLQPQDQFLAVTHPIPEKINDNNSFNQSNEDTNSVLSSSPHSLQPLTLPQEISNEDGVRPRKKAPSIVRLALGKEVLKQYSAYEIFLEYVDQKIKKMEQTSGHSMTYSEQIHMGNKDYLQKILKLLNSLIKHSPLNAFTIGGTIVTAVNRQNEKINPQHTTVILNSLTPISLELLRSLKQKISEAIAEILQKTRVYEEILFSDPPANHPPSFSEDDISQYLNEESLNQLLPQPDYYLDEQTMFALNNMDEGHSPQTWQHDEVITAPQSSSEDQSLLERDIPQQQCQQQPIPYFERLSHQLKYPSLKSVQTDTTGDDEIITFQKKQRYS